MERDAVLSNSVCKIPKAFFKGEEKKICCLKFGLLKKPDLKSTDPHEHITLLCCVKSTSLLRTEVVRQLFLYLHTQLCQHLTWPSIKS